MARYKDEAIEEAEDDYQQARREQVAWRAATLVARGTPRDQALDLSLRTQEEQEAAVGDLTGTLSTLDEAQEPSAPRSAKERAQIEAIAKALIEKIP